MFQADPEEFTKSLVDFLSLELNSKQEEIYQPTQSLACIKKNSAMLYEFLTSVECNVTIGTWEKVASFLQESPSFSQSALNPELKLNQDTINTITMLLDRVFYSVEKFDTKNYYETLRKVQQSGDEHDTLIVDCFCHYFLKECQFFLRAPSQDLIVRISQAYGSMIVQVFFCLDCRQDLESFQWHS